MDNSIKRNTLRSIVRSSHYKIDRDSFIHNISTICNKNITLPITFDEISSHIRLSSERINIHTIAFDFIPHSDVLFKIVIHRDRTIMIKFSNRYVDPSFIGLPSTFPAFNIKNCIIFQHCVHKLQPCIGSCLGPRLLLPAEMIIHLGNMCSSHCCLYSADGQCRSCLYVRQKYLSCKFLEGNEQIKKVMYLLFHKVSWVLICSNIFLHLLTIFLYQAGFSYE